MSEYPHSLTIRDQVINYRSWKLKDKSKYTSLIADVEKRKDSLTSADQSDFTRAFRQILVLDCIEQDIVLNNDEFQHIMVQIRSKSINHGIVLEMECSNCSADYDHELDIIKVLVSTASNFKTLNAGKLSLEFKRPINQKMYNDLQSRASSEFEALYIDFIQHIYTVNGDILTSEEKIELFNEQDVNDIEKIFAEWEPMRFKTNRLSSSQCTSCSHIEEFIVDDIPGFFPISWVS